MAKLGAHETKVLDPAEFAKFDVKEMYDELGLAYEDVNWNDEGRLRSIEWALSQLSAEGHDSEAGSKTLHTVLDIGCASGRPVVQLLANASNAAFRPLLQPGNSAATTEARHIPPLSVHGLDLSPGQLTLARKLVPTATFHLGDLRTWSPPPSILPLDCITSFYTLNHLPQAEYVSAMQRIASWLKVGGIFAFGNVANLNGVVTFMNKYDVHASSMTETEYVRILEEECGFEVIKAWQEEFKSERNPDAPGKTDQLIWAIKKREV